MKINVKQTNRILWILGIVMVVAGGVWCIFLNEAQRIIVGIGLALAIINLLGLSYFFNRNAGGGRSRRRQR